MQISQSRFFILVEGWSDRFFYASLAALRCAASGIKYEVVTAHELPGPSFGKPALLNFFTYLRKQRALLTTLGEKRTAVLFCLDKDVDDLRRTMKRSPHISYTEHCDLENYYFIHGDLIRAGAAAAALDPTLVRAAIGNTTNWRRQKAEQWKTWTVLCVLNQLLDLRGPCAYGRRDSLVNRGGFGAEEPAAVTRMLATLHASSGLGQTEFNAHFVRTQRSVEALIKAGQWDRVFKGKWYPVWLAGDVRQAAGQRQINANGLDARIRDAVGLTLDLEAPWTQLLTGRLDRVIAMVV
jgi:hypothetical protein